MRKFNPEKELNKIQHGNKNKVILFVFLLLVVGVIGYSFALYQVRYSKRIIYTKVAPFNTSDLDLAIYVNGEKQNEAPNKDDGYAFVDLLCDKAYTGEITWDAENKVLSQLQTQMPIPNKCNAYFVNAEYSVSKTFEYNGTNGSNGSIQEYIVPKDGLYKLEVWGAQGGTYAQTWIGGNGGYSKGVIELKKNDKLFIVVGGTSSNTLGGYNGGGAGGLGHAGENMPTGYGGGGATHIATMSGLLSELENYKSEILIVAGGGGGASCKTNGGSGGGLAGSDILSVNDAFTAKGGTQNSGYAFGQGQAGRTASQHFSCGSEGNGGGGGGYYGGFAVQENGTDSDASGAGGSGYLSPKLTNTQTINGQNTGAGKAKITCLGPA